MNVHRRSAAARKGARTRRRMAAARGTLVLPLRGLRGTCPPGAIPDRHVRTLLALIEVHRLEHRATIRDVQYVVGHRSPNTTHLHLRALERSGLVAGLGPAGQLRPTVTYHQPIHRKETTA